MEGTLIVKTDAGRINDVETGVPGIQDRFCGTADASTNHTHSFLNYRTFLGSKVLAEICMLWAQLPVIYIN